MAKAIGIDLGTTNESYENRIQLSQLDRFLFYFHPWWRIVIHDCTVSELD